MTELWLHILSNDDQSRSDFGQRSWNVMPLPTAENKLAGAAKSSGSPTQQRPAGVFLMEYFSSDELYQGSKRQNSIYTEVAC